MEGSDYGEDGGDDDDDDDDLVESLYAITLEGDIFRLDVSLEPSVQLALVGSGPKDSSSLCFLYEDLAIVLRDMGDHYVYAVRVMSSERISSM